MKLKHRNAIKLARCVRFGVVHRVAFGRPISGLVATYASAGIHIWLPAGRLGRDERPVRPRACRSAC